MIAGAFASHLRGALCRLLVLLSLVAVTPANAELAVTDPWILIDTQARTLSVFSDNMLLDRFDNIALGRGGTAADKLRDDGTTPLGSFHIDRIKLNSPFLYFFGIDYPRPEHAKRALDAGRIGDKDYRRILAAFKKNKSPPQDTPLGGHLGIHGIGPGNKVIHDEFDWTQGCVALSNDQIERLLQWIYIGMRVEVR